MQAALQNHCNLNSAAAAKIIAQGYNTPAELTTLSKDGVKNLVNHINRNVAGVNVPFRAIEGLLNFRYWVVLTKCMGVATLPGDYDQAERDFVAEVCKDYQAWKLANSDEHEAPKPLHDFKK